MVGFHGFGMQFWNVGCFAAVSIVCAFCNNLSFTSSWNRQFGEDIAFITLRNPEDWGDMFSKTSVWSIATAARYKLPESIYSKSRAVNPVATHYWINSSTAQLSWVKMYTVTNIFCGIIAYGSSKNCCCGQHIDSIFSTLRHYKTSIHVCVFMA
jgi:hypothetical protein